MDSILCEYIDEFLHLHHQVDLHPRDEDFEMHVHDHYEIMCFIKGEGKYLIEGSTYPLSHGALLLTRPTESHRIKILADKPYERYVIYFYPRLLDIVDPEYRLLEPFLVHPLGQGNLYLPEEFQKESPLELIRAMVEPTESHAERRLAILTHLYPLLDTIRQAFRRKKPSEERSIPTGPAESIIDHVNRHLTEELSLDILAGQFFLSPSQFSRLFKQATGSSVWEYITIKRLMLAQAKIRTGISPTAACQECGFHDYSAFYRAYTHRFGNSPKKDMP